MDLATMQYIYAQVELAKLTHTHEDDVQAEHWLAGMDDAEKRWFVALWGAFTGTCVSVYLASVQGMPNWLTFVCVCATFACWAGVASAAWHVRAVVSEEN